MLMFVEFVAQALTKVEDHVKNYRPKILLLSGNPGDRPALMDFASLLTKKVYKQLVIFSTPFESEQKKCVECPLCFFRCPC